MPRQTDNLSGRLRSDVSWKTQINGGVRGFMTQDELWENFVGCRRGLVMTKSSSLHTIGFHYQLWPSSFCLLLGWLRKARSLDLLQPGELETDLDEVLVPVSVISANDIQRPEVKIGHSHATIPRHYSWVHLDYQWLSPGPGPHLPRHARPGAQQPVHGLLPVRQHLVNSWITKNIFFKKKSSLNW